MPPHARLVELHLRIEFANTFSAANSAYGNVISSISTSEVFYQRPDSESNSDVDYANGYSPYWAVKLSPVTMEDKLLATNSRLTPMTVSPNMPLNNEYGMDNESWREQAAGLPVYQEAGFGSVSINADLSLYANDVQNYTYDVIDEGLNRVLASSVRQLVSNNANDGSTGINLSTAITHENMANEAEVAIQSLTEAGVERPYNEAMQEAERLAQELNDEFVSIRTIVSDKFELAHQGTLLMVEEELAEISTEIAHLRAEIKSGNHNGESLDNFQRQIRSNQQKAQQLTAKFKHTLATRLMDIVAETTDEYVMKYSEALYTVEEWLRLDLEQIPLPWTEKLNEE